MTFPNQEVTQLRKSGRLEDAYTRGYELLREHPEDKYLKGAIGWVLYEKIKNIVESSEQCQDGQKEIMANRIKDLLGEYYRLQLDRPDLLFSLLLKISLEFSKKFKFLPKFLPKFSKWAGIESFRHEDCEVGTGKDGKVFPSLVEKTAQKVSKIVFKKSPSDSSLNKQELEDLRRFTIKLIDYALTKTKVQAPQWLYYRKALLLHELGESKEAELLLIPVVKQKRNEYWAWHALAKVIEISDPNLALSLCAKACLSCNDSNLELAVNVFEDLSWLALRQDNYPIAKWAADQAFSIRCRNQWKIPQSLRNLLDSSWYAETEDLSNPDQILTDLAADAEKVIWENCPEYNANYLGSFTTKKGKTMIKFGRFFQGKSEEIVHPVKKLLDNLELTLGEPVLMKVDDSGERPIIISVKKRSSGQFFDSLPHESGQFKQKGQFGFVNDVFVPPHLVDQLEDGQMIKVACIRKLDKKKNKWGLSAIAIIHN